MSSSNNANRGVVFNPRGGKPARVTKPSATPRRPNRRPNDAVLNQDPSLDPDLTDAPDGLEHHEHEHQEQSPPDEEHHLGPEEQHLDHHEHHGSHDSHDPHEHHDHHEHHDDFDAETAAAAAAVAAEHHVQQQQQQHEQQQQMDLSAAASILTSNGTNPMLARDSGYQNVVVESALAKRLSREPGMRLATQRRPEQSLNLQRRSNVEALFAHIAGEMAPVPCKNCHKGHGPWTTCVVVDGQMCGSCANCWFNASGARCSFHETRNPPAHANVIAPDGAFQLPPIPSAALTGFNYASVPSSSDPVVRYTVERAMADLRAADKRTRQMLMIEVAAKQLAWNILQYEETQPEDHQVAQTQVDVQGQPPPPSMLDDQDGP
ncbi:hypothetical protein PG997_012810 [Apiospora hydei]|uniref:IBR domain-containing protein n=1 Tax=Apiospora hydei TaxID=1337664 RepID=A0ABR1V7V7_9PEZI